MINEFLGFLEDLWIYLRGYSILFVIGGIDNVLIREECLTVIYDLS